MPRHHRHHGQSVAKARALFHVGRVGLPRDVETGGNWPETGAQVVVVELIRQLSAPLAPRPVAGCLPRLARIGGVRGVLFDVYGTLLISAAGDIGSRSRLAGRRSVRRHDGGIGSTPV